MAKPASPAPSPVVKTTEKTNGVNGSHSASSTNGSPTVDYFSNGIQIPKRNGLSLTKSQSFIKSKFRSSSGIAFDGHRSVQDFLKTLRNERFRYMPHDGSNWDKVFKWAENIGGIVLQSHDTLHEFMLNSEDATRVICDSLLSLLQLGSKHIKANIKIFGVFHQIVLALAVFFRQHHLFKTSSEVRRELAHAYSVFAHLTLGVSHHYSSEGHAHDASDFESEFGDLVSVFYRHLESISTSLWASEIHGSQYDIATIREFLTPQDTVVQNILSNQLYSEFHRAEFTCEWFGSHLKKFTRNRNGNRVLLVTGPAASGKTVLSHWIHEKLQESIDDEPYDVISYFVDANVRYTTNPLSVVKSLLLQLLDRKIGHGRLLSKIQEAIQAAESGSTSAQVEAALWAALDAALEKGKLVILIDGLDHISGARIGNPPVLETLNRITQHRTQVKAILLGRPVSDSALKHCQQHVSLEQEDNSADIRLFIESSIHARPSLRSLKEKERESIVHKVLDASKGSFLLADLVLKSVRDDKPASSILKFLETAPKTVDEAIDKLFANVDTTVPETKQILSWVLAAERPLTLKELKAFLEIDLDRCSYGPRFSEVGHIIRNACGYLVVIRDGLVQLRHPSIRERLISTSGSAKWVINLKEAHRELVLRSLAFITIHVKSKKEPQAEKLSSKELKDVFAKYDLLEYAARYWLSHFRSSSLFEASGKHNLSGSFQAVFSSSTLLALVEGSVLARQYITIEGEKLQSLAYTIRKTLFGEHSAVVLQSLIFLLLINQRLRSSHVAEYSYEAWKIGRHVCHSSVVLELAKAYIEATLTVKANSSEKEQVLVYIVETLRHEHREIDAVYYIRTLADLYISINKVEKAVTLYRELYTIRTRTLGYLHSETLELYEILLFHLKAISHFETILEITLEYHEYLERTLTITDERRIKSTLTLVEIFEERKEVYRAEEILVRFWKQVSSETKTTRVTELRTEFGLKYSEFLIRHSRKEESEVILRAVWIEVQTSSEETRFESTMIKRTQQIAEYFSKLEIHTVARSIYTSLYSYYEKTEQRTSTEALTIATYMAESVTKSISTSTTTLTKEETHTLLEVFHSSLKSTHVSSTTIKVCIALCSSYIKEERYEEAIELYSLVLREVWTSIETYEASIEYSHEFSVEIIEIALSLAHCRFALLQVEAAVTIYWNIFRSLICSGHHEHHFILKTVKLIIAFFEKIYRYEKVIEIYRELFVFMPIVFGKSHAATIEILYAFAAIAFRVGLRQEAAAAYFYIYSSFRIGTKCLHLEGVRAALLLAEIYELEERWEEAVEVYGYLWRTYLTYGESYKLEVKTVETIFSRYAHILEHKRTTEYTFLRQIAIDYRESCKRYYGVHHELTIKATLVLAEISEKREEYHEETVSLYSEVIKYSKETKTSTSFTQTIQKKVTKQLAEVYSSKSTTLSKAVELHHEEYEAHRRTERCSTQTLTALRSLVQTYKKQQTTESITKASQTLRTSVLDIFSHETSSEKLIESAKSIAQTYKETQLVEYASQVITELRSKVIEEVKSHTAQSVSTQSKSYVFLASFVSTIHESRSFSSVTAELRSEILMYESYYRSTRTQKDALSIIKSGYRLYFHLEKSQHSEFVKFEQELLQHFNKYLNLKHQVTQSVLQSFFRITLAEIQKSTYERVVIDRATTQVLEYTRRSQFREAYDLSLLIDRFIHLQGGFRNEHTIRTGFNLAKYLAGIGTKRSSDEKFYATLLDLSRSLLLESLEGMDKIEMAYTELSDLLVDLVSLLSEQKKYQDLERILTLLWASRQIHESLPSQLILWIGRSLVETRACLGNFHAAIHLAKDIRYNLTHVRGELDKTTLEFTILLSELYTASKEYRKAAELHEEVLSFIADGPGAHDGLSSKDLSSIATTHAELLKRAVQRRGKFERGPQPYTELFGHLDQRFGDEGVWKKQAPRSIEAWSPGKASVDDVGIWKAPKRFGWGIEGEETDSVRKRREEMVRRRSSNWARRWQGAEVVS